MKSKRKGVLFLVLILLVGVCYSAYSYKTKGVFIGFMKKKLPIYCVDTEEKNIAITFDASWGADKTEKILDILDEYDIKATFFLVGRWVDEYEEEVKEIAERGHEIGNHSNTHPDMTRLSKVQIAQEIQITSAKVLKLTGESTKLFRCPSGSYNDAVLEAIEGVNHYCIQWDVDSIDWKAQGADVEYNRVIKKTKPGSIVLFHNDAKYTPENLPRIIEKLKADGYKFVKVSDLIYKEDYHIDFSGKQIKN